MKDLFDRLRDAISPGETERRHREEVRLREEEVLHRIQVDALFDRVKHDTSFYGTAEGACCDGADVCAKTITIVLSDGQEKYPRKTPEQIAFTALILSGNFGPSVMDWYNSENKATL